MTLSVLRKSRLLSLLRLFSTIRVPGRNFEKSMSTSYRSAPPCRNSLTVCDFGISPPSVATMVIG